MTGTYLDAVLVGPRDTTPRPIELVDPDPGWPDRFAEHRDRIRAALGDRALQVEHIGSTSVPGLRAKPRIDVLVAVPDPTDPEVVTALEAAGYRLKVREPGHRCLVETRDSPSDANVHVWADGSAEVDRHLLFRDRLRTHHEDRDRYQARKEELATQLWADVNFYAEAKGELIEEIIGPAQDARRAQD